MTTPINRKTALLAVVPHRLVRALTAWAWKPIIREYEAAALCGTHDIESVETAFFNHDSNGSEPQPGQWEKRREQWRSFKGYLATHRTVAREERQNGADQRPSEKGQAP